MRQMIDPIAILCCEHKMEAFKKNPKFWDQVVDTLFEGKYAEVSLVQNLSLKLETPITNWLDNIVCLGWVSHEEI